MNKCEECGKSMVDSNGQVQGGRYCCKGCEEKAWRRNHTFSCKICGKEYLANTGIFGPKANGYCSEECQRKGLLKILKPKAEKALNTLQKDVEKRNVLIDNLSDALRSNDPKAIAKAIKNVKGGLFIRLARLIWRTLIAIPLIVGLICIARGAIMIYKANVAYAHSMEHTELQREAINTNSVVSLEKKIAESTVTETASSNTTSTEVHVITSPIEEGTTSVNNPQ